MAPQSAYEDPFSFPKSTIQHEAKLRAPLLSQEFRRLSQASLFLTASFVSATASQANDLRNAWDRTYSKLAYALEPSMIKDYRESLAFRSIPAHWRVETIDIQGHDILCCLSTPQNPKAQVISLLGLNAVPQAYIQQVKDWNQQGLSVIQVRLPHDVPHDADLTSLCQELENRIFVDLAPELSSLISDDLPTILKGHSTGALMILDALTKRQSTSASPSFNNWSIQGAVLEAPFLGPANASKRHSPLSNEALNWFASLYPDRRTNETLPGRIHAFFDIMSNGAPSYGSTVDPYLAHVHQLDEWSQDVTKQSYRAARHKHMPDFPVLIYSGKRDWVADHKTIQSWANDMRELGATNIELIPEEKGHTLTLEDPSVSQSMRNNASYWVDNVSYPALPAPDLRRFSLTL